MKEIFLREIAEADLPAFFEHQLDPVANQMAAFPARSKDNFMKHWTTKVLGNDRAEKKAIVVDDRSAGYVVCWQQDDKRLVGYWLGRDYWGQGIATRALAEFVKTLKARPLHAYVAKHNAGSIRVLEKCGFKKIGESKIIEDQREIEEELWMLDEAGTGSFT